MPWKRWSENPGAKLLSFFVALALWISVTNQIEFENEYDFPVEYVNKPTGLTTLQVLPSRVTAKVRGKGKFLGYRLRGGVCRVDLSGYQVGQNRILFTGQDMVLPNDVEVSRIEVIDPRRVTVEFDETVIRDIPIMPTLQGQPAAKHVQVGKTFLSPPMARVKGPRKLVDEITLLPTVPIDIKGQKNPVRKRVRLEPPPSPTVEITPMTVDIGITVEPLQQRTLEDLTLVVPAESAVHGRVSFRPAVLSIEIEAAKSIVEVAEREVTSLVLTADAWSIGTTILKFVDVQEGQVVFVPQESLPFRTEGGDSAEPRVDPLPPDRPRPGQLVESDASTLPPGRLPPAVVGEVRARLPLPREVDILSVSPDRLVVSVSEQGEEPEPASGRAD